MGGIDSTHGRVAHFCYYVKDYYCMVFIRTASGVLGGTGASCEVWDLNPHPRKQWVRHPAGTTAMPQSYLRKDTV